MEYSIPTGSLSDAEICDRYFELYPNAPRDPKKFEEMATIKRSMRQSGAVANDPGARAISEIRNKLANSYEAIARELQRRIGAAS